MRTKKGQRSHGFITFLLLTVILGVCQWSNAQKCRVKWQSSASQTKCSWSKKKKKKENRWINYKNTTAHSTLKLTVSPENS